MRKSKKIFACLFIGIGILVLPFSFIKGFPVAFIVSAGCALIAYGIADFLFEHFVHKAGRAKIMDENERNMLINGKAYTLVSEFANIGFIVLVLYSAICKSDRAGCMIAVGIFLLSHIVYAVCFKYFDIHSQHKTSKRIRFAILENGHINKDTEDSIKQRLIAVLFQFRQDGQAT